MEREKVLAIRYGKERAQEEGARLIRAREKQPRASCLYRVQKSVLKPIGKRQVVTCTERRLQGRYGCAAGLGQESGNCGGTSRKSKTFGGLWAHSRAACEARIGPAATSFGSHARRRRLPLVHFAYTRSLRTHALVAYGIP